MIRTTRSTLIAILWHCAALCAITLTRVESAHAQPGSIGGTVFVDPGDKPLANAEVALANSNRSTRSDSAGNFVLTGLNPGKYSVTVRLPGYEAFNIDINLAPGQRFEADYLMKVAAPTLAPVDVKANPKVDNGMWTIKLRDFEERRALGTGKYFTAAEFEKEDGRPASSFLLKKIAGLKIVQVNGEHILASLRGGTNKSFAYDPAVKYPPACYMQIILNGRIEYSGARQPMFDIDALNSKDIIGLEFYTLANTPLQYSGTGGQCGTVVIWTKGG